MTRQEQLEYIKDILLSELNYRVSIGGTYVPPFVYIPVLI